MAFGFVDTEQLIAAFRNYQTQVELVSLRFHRYKFLLCKAGDVGMAHY
jgi:hypothetical protein